jgi:hypothetical protein
MTKLSRLALVATVAAAGVASPMVAMAQSAWTTGTASNREAAGYASPYGSGSGRQAFAMIPRTGLHAFAMVPDLQSGSAFNPSFTGGGSTGYNESLRKNQW